MSTGGCRRFSIGLVRLMCNSLRAGGRRQQEKTKESGEQEAKIIFKSSAKSLLCLFIFKI
jgi:hypothetical protein